MARSPSVAQVEPGSTKPVTYTVVVTLSGRQPADVVALASRIQHDLEVGTAAGAPYESASVDVIEGDAVRFPANKDDPAYRIKRLHRELRRA